MLPRGKAIEPWRRLYWCVARRDTVGEPGDEAAGHRGVDERVAPRGNPDRGDEFLWRQALEQKAARSGGEGTVDVLVGIECGQHQDPGARSICGQDRFGCCQSIEFR